MKKRISSFVLVVSIITSLITTITFTASAYTEDIYTYTVANGEATITDCNNSASGTLDIPSTLGGYSVTSIDDYAFQYCIHLTSITIPYSVTSIGDNAFEYCKNLTSITVDNNNTYYSSDDNGVLYNKTKSIIMQYPSGKQNDSFAIPNSVTSIGDRAFSACKSLTSITIPHSVTSIGNYAFSACYSLTSITIPYGVISIGDCVFSECTSLTSITVDNNNAYYSSDDNDVLYNKTKTIIMQYPIGKQYDSFAIPNSVTSIGYGAFRNCYRLTNITIPYGVTSIGNWAFSACKSLTSITLPHSVTSIGGCAFYMCESLTSITIPNSVISIGDWAFFDCESLTSITIPNDVTSIGNSAFSACYSLISITIPNGVTSIGDSAFENCKRLTDVYYSGSEEKWKKISIGSYNDYLTNATIHYNCTTTPKISDVTDIADIITGETVINASVTGENISSVFLNTEITDVFGNTTKNAVEMAEMDGKYSADMPSIENGYSVDVWVSAYNISGNKAESQKQHALVINKIDDNPAVAITKIDNGNISVKCIGFDDITNTKVYLSTYDNGGNLMQIKTSNLANDIIFNDISDAPIIKAFVWKNMKPLCKSSIAIK